MHDILLNNGLQTMYTLFSNIRVENIYSMLVPLQCYNFIFGPNEYIILISEETRFLVKVFNTKKTKSKAVKITAILIENGIYLYLDVQISKESKN